MNSMNISRFHLCTILVSDKRTPRVQRVSANFSGNNSRLGTWLTLRCKKDYDGEFKFKPVLASIVDFRAIEPLIFNYTLFQEANQ